MPVTAETPLPASPLATNATRTAAPAEVRNDREAELGRVRALSWLLDRAYLDPLLGFFLPGVGDVIGAVVGTYTISVALRLGVPPIVIARMLLNLAVDAALGLVPFVGDLGDIAFRAHRKNLALLNDRAPARRARPGDWLLVLGAFALFIGALVLMVWGVIRLVGAIT